MTFDKYQKEVKNFWNTFGILRSDSYKNIANLESQIQRPSVSEHSAFETHWPLPVQGLLGGITGNKENRCKIFRIE